MTAIRRDPAGQPLCDCPYGDDPCILYPMGRRRGRTGRCEGCAMGLHKGHRPIRRLDEIDPGIATIIRAIIRYNHHRQTKVTK